MLAEVFRDFLQSLQARIMPLIRRRLLALTSFPSRFPPIILPLETMLNYLKY
jgi:hypothetical protein